MWRGWTMVIYHDQAVRGMRRSETGKTNAVFIVKRCSILADKMGRIQFEIKNNPMFGFCPEDEPAMEKDQNICHMW